VAEIITTYCLSKCFTKTVSISCPPSVDMRSIFQQDYPKLKSWIEKVPKKKECEFNENKNGDLWKVEERVDKPNSFNNTLIR
jgi:hypothetical protein